MPNGTYNYPRLLIDYSPYLQQATFPVRPGKPELPWLDLEILAAYLRASPSPRLQLPAAL